MSVRKSKLAILAFVYGVVLIIAFASLCWFSIVECTVAESIDIGEAIIPGLIVVFASCAVGLGVSFVCLVFNESLSEKLGNAMWLASPVVGVLSGTLVRLVYDRLSAGSFDVALLDLGYLPFAIAGIVVGVLSVGPSIRGHEAFRS